MKLNIETRSQVSLGFWVSKIKTDTAGARFPNSWCNQTTSVIGLRQKQLRVRFCTREIDKLIICKFAFIQIESWEFTVILDEKWKNRVFLKNGQIKYGIGGPQKNSCNLSWAFTFIISVYQEGSGRLHVHKIIQFQTFLFPHLCNSIRSEAGTTTHSLLSLLKFLEMLIARQTSLNKFSCFCILPPTMLPP